MSLGRMVGFFGIAGSILFGIHYYLWARLVRDPHLPAPWGPVATWMLAGMALLVILGMAVSREAPRDIASPIMWVAFVWLGVMFFLLFLTGTLDLARAIGMVAHRVFGDGPIDDGRRQI